MTLFNMWEPSQQLDYKFIDGNISEWFNISGTDVEIYKYLGTFDQGEKNDPTQPSYMNENGKISERNIQDKLFLENRDRCYSEQKYILRGVYNVNDLEFSLRQFAAFIDTDVITIEFHYNDMIDKLGRKIMSGDVFEFPHLRDFNLLDENSPAINKFYMVQDASFSADGYSPTWYRHIWKCKCKPIHDSQEVKDILDRQDEMNPQNTLGELMSDYNTNIDINKSVMEKARSNWSHRMFEHEHFYLTKDNKAFRLPEIFRGEGKLPNNAILIGSGRFWPLKYEEGDYFLRTDWYPHILYTSVKGEWIPVKFRYRTEVHSGHEMLTSFVNNDFFDVLNSGEVIPQKQDIKKAIKPKADF